MSVTPAFAQKAARLKVVALGGGRYQVAGDHGIYDLRVADGAATCNCQAGLNGKACTHKDAVLDHHKKANQSQ